TDGVVNQPDTTAPELESAEVNAAGEVVGSFDEDLNEAFEPDLEDITLTEDGEEVAVADVIVSGNTVTLVPATPILPGQTVNVTYSDDNTDSDDNGIADASENHFSTRHSSDLTDGVVNQPDTTAPELESAEVNAAGE